MSDKPIFSERLRKWRKGLDLLQKEAADLLSVPFGTFRAWEEGKRTPGALAIAEIERRMEVRKKK